MRPLPLLAFVLAALLAASCGMSMPKSPWESSAAAAAAAPVDPRERLVRSFNVAFNSQDALAMAPLVTSDVQWIAVKGPSVHLETKNKEELLRSMIAYFKACPTCRSRLAQVIVAKTRVSVLEIATWTAADGKHEAQGFVVYEFEGKQFAAPKISRVYYFPSES